MSYAVERRASRPSCRAGTPGAPRVTLEKLEGKTRMIQLKNITKSYSARAEENNGGHTLINALDDISLSIAPGEWVAVMGPSGSGKSTLVNLVGCLDRPTSGEISLDGQNIANLSASELNTVRTETLGVVFHHFHVL